MWLETANSYVSAHWLNISQLPNIGALANTLPLVLEQPASGKQPAGFILYFQLHNLLVAQTGWLANKSPFIHDSVKPLHYSRHTRGMHYANRPEAGLIWEYISTHVNTANQHVHPVNYCSIPKVSCRAS